MAEYKAFSVPKELKKKDIESPFKSNSKWKVFLKMKKDGKKIENSEVRTVIKLNDKRGSPLSLNQTLILQLYNKAREETNGGEIQGQHW